MVGRTPAVHALQSAGIAFSEHRYTHDPAAPSYGLEAAEALGLSTAQVFKTLMLEVEERPYVAIVPVARTVDLKRVAAAIGAKRARMMDVAVAERLTGYIAGGISPFGQKRRWPTLLDETALTFETVYVSGGQRGFDLGLAPQSLVVLLDAVVADIAR